MFTQLNSLLKSSSSLTVLLAANKDDTITVTVLPKSKQTGEGANALSTPLCLTGTPEELDAGFVDALNQYVGSRQSLIEQLETTTIILDAAKKEAQGKATSAISKASKTAKPAVTETTEATSGSDDTDSEVEDDDENGGDDTTEGTGSTETNGTTSNNTNAAAATPGAGDLWA